MIERHIDLVAAKAPVIFLIGLPDLVLQVVGNAVAQFPSRARNSKAGGYRDHRHGGPVPIPWHDGATRICPDIVIDKMLGVDREVSAVLSKRRHSPACKEGRDHKSEENCMQTNARGSKAIRRTCCHLTLHNHSQNYRRPHPLHLRIRAGNSQIQ